MRKSLALLSFCINLSLYSMFALGPEQYKELGLERGMLAPKSIDKLVFGKDGILFIADTASAKIYAMATHDKRIQIEQGRRFELMAVDEKIASLLNTSSKEIFFRDLAVNQQSQVSYMAIKRGNGDSATHHLFKVGYKRELEPVDLSDVAFATYQLEGVPSEDAVGRNNRKMRPYAVTTMGMDGDTLCVAGLSNDAFASIVRRIPFPFVGNEKTGSLEYYHVARGKYQSNTPVNTLVPWHHGGKDYMVTGFYGTPIVVFPLVDFGADKKIMGKTVAELGAFNMPVDIRHIEYDGKEYFMVANTYRPLMFLKADDIVKQEALTTPLTHKLDTKGVPFTMIPGYPTIQLDVFDENNLVIMRRGADGRLNMAAYEERLILGLYP